MPEPVHIDAETALRVLDECVAERGPDYRYTDLNSEGECRYWHDEDNTPGCVIGLALYKLGVPPDVFSAHNAGKFGLVALRLEASGHIKVTQSAKRILEDAQDDQDNGQTWGKAVAYARANYKQGFPEGEL